MCIYMGVAIYLEQMKHPNLIIIFLLLSFLNVVSSFFLSPKLLKKKQLESSYFTANSYN